MTKKETYPKYITKVKIIQKYTILENILFTLGMFAVAYFSIFAMLFIFSKIDTFIFSL